jgi:formate dehydrogenase subunit gamma
MRQLRHLLVLTLFLGATLFGAMLLAVPAAQAQLYQVPGQTAPASKEEVPLYRTEEKTRGRITIPDEKLAVLVQPEGREWREFRTSWLRWGAGILILGAAALLALFYLIRGTIRIEKGRSGLRVPRFNGFERFAHWTTAVSFIVMALTGLIITFGRPLLIPLIGHQAHTALADTAKYAHNFFSVPFVVGLLLVFVVWVRDNLPEKADWIWVKEFGGLLRKGGAHPETGRFNAGQKIVFWSVVLGGGLLALTGYLLMMPFFITGVGGMQIMHVIHGVLAALMIAAILGHIYIGTIGMEGAFDAMGSGEVDENWAKEHHLGWYNKLTGRSARGRAGTRVHPAE